MFEPLKQIKNEARDLIAAAIKAAMDQSLLPAGELPDFGIEIPGDPVHGDLSSNAALAGAKVFRMAPRKIADAIAEKIDLAGTSFDKVEVAGAGFINFYLGSAYYSNLVRGIISAGADYGHTNWGRGQKYMVEFVSANPTGPMHLGNARGGALGDCLSSVLATAGCDVTREFYVNDAGNQIQKFGKSLATRALQQVFGEKDYPLPEEYYQGADIVEHARNYLAECGAVLAESCKGLTGDALYGSEAYEALKDALVSYALPKNIEGLRTDLEKYRINYDVWFLESQLHNSGLVDDIVAKMLANGACYRAEDGTIMYRSAQFAEKYGVANKKVTADGEDEGAKDEVLVRANGVPTYFAADIAYHYNKFVIRGFDRVVNIWGADHHGHVARMKGAMDAIGLDGEKLDIVLMQMVNLMSNGEPVRMSKRTGKAIGLSTLLDEISVDAARFFFNLREPKTHLDFDLDLAIKNSSDNPVYYVQYAHARICSILKGLAEGGTDLTAADNADCSSLICPEEYALMRQLAKFPEEIDASAASYDPSRITRYVVEVATRFHKFYTACRIKGAEEPVMFARIALCKATKQVILNCLEILKVSAPTSM